MTQQRSDVNAGASSHLTGPVVSVPRWLTRQRVEPALWAVPIVVAVALAATHRWTSEDGFVYLRTVDQIMAGNGPVFNAGERVEAFTSPLWLALLAIGDAIIPLRLEFIAPALSIAATATGLILATTASAHLFDHGRGGAGASTPIRLPLGLLTFSVLWPVWIWASGAVETGLTFAWLGACLWYLTRWARGHSGTAAHIGTIPLVVLGSGSLVRPELTLSSVLFVATVVWGARASSRRRIGLVVIAAAVPVMYQLFRMGYYGMVLSSASVGREDTTPRPGFGWDYFSDFVSPYLLVVPLVAVILAVYVPVIGRLGDRTDRRAVVIVVMAASGLVNAAVVIVIVGGDSVHGRALLPALFALLAPIFVVPAAGRHVEAIVAVTIWAALCGPLLRPTDASSRLISLGYPGGGLTIEDAGYETRGPDQPWIDGPGLYLANPFESTGEPVEIALADPDAVIVASEAIGAVGYALGPGVTVLDLNGIADPLTGHQAMEFRYLPGQEKSGYAPWLAARLAADPGTVQPGDVPLDLPFAGTTSPLSYLTEVQWAAAALECTDLARLHDAYTAPLTAGRFVTNLGKAMSNTSLRYDAIPSDAYADADCGDELPEQVQAFYESVVVGTRLPSNPQPTAVAAPGRCAAVFLATGADDDPWAAVDARSSDVTITLDPADTTARLAALFVIGPVGSQSVVWIQTDGEGNYHIRQEVNWYPPIVSEPAEISADEPVTVSIVPDLDAARWRTIVDGQPLADLPMLAADESHDDVLLAVVPTRAAPGLQSPAVTIEHESYSISRTCQELLAQHSGPGRGGLPTITRALPLMS